MYIKTSVGDDKESIIPEPKYATARFTGSIVIAGIVIYGLVYTMFHKKKKKSISHKRYRKYTKSKPLPLP